MLTSAQVDAIREHVELDEPILRLVRLACTDLYEGPVHVTTDDDDDDDPYPGFVSACRMIREAIPRTDLYLDTEADVVIGDTEPDDPEDLTHVLCVDHRIVVRALVGRELAEYL